MVPAGVDLAYVAAPLRAAAFGSVATLDCAVFATQRPSRAEVRASAQHRTTLSPVFAIHTRGGVT